METSMICVVNLIGSDCQFKQIGLEKLEEKGNGDLILKVCILSRSFPNLEKIPELILEIEAGNLLSAPCSKGSDEDFVLLIFKQFVFMDIRGNDAMRNMTRELLIRYKLLAFIMSDIIVLNKTYSECLESHAIFKSELIEILAIYFREYTYKASDKTFVFLVSECNQKVVDHSDLEELIYRRFEDILLCIDPSFDKFQKLFSVRVFYLSEKCQSIEQYAKMKNLLMLHKKPMIKNELVNQFKQIWDLIRLNAHINLPLGQDIDSKLQHIEDLRNLANTNEEEDDNSRYNGISEGIKTIKSEVDGICQDINRRISSGFFDLDIEDSITSFKKLPCWGDERASFEIDREICKLHDAFFKLKHHEIIVCFNNMEINSPAQLEGMKQILTDNQQQLIKLKENLKPFDSNLVADFSYCQEIIDHKESLICSSSSDYQESSSTQIKPDIEDLALINPNYLQEPVQPNQIDIDRDLALSDEIMRLQVVFEEKQSNIDKLKSKIEQGKEICQNKQKYTELKLQDIESNQVFYEELQKDINSRKGKKKFDKNTKSGIETQKSFIINRSSELVEEIQLNIDIQKSSIYALQILADELQSLIQELKNSLTEFSEEAQSVIQNQMLQRETNQSFAEETNYFIGHYWNYIEEANSKIQLIIIQLEENKRVTLKKR